MLVRRQAAFAQFEIAIEGNVPFAPDVSDTYPLS